MDIDRWKFYWNRSGAVGLGVVLMDGSVSEILWSGIYTLRDDLLTLHIFIYIELRYILDSQDVFEGFSSVEGKVLTFGQRKGHDRAGKFEHGNLVQFPFSSSILSTTSMVSVNSCRDMQASELARRINCNNK